MQWCTGCTSAERGLLHQLVGAGTVKADPVIFPRVGFICRIGDELVGFGEEEITLLQIIGSAVDLIHTFARNNKMDQVMVTHTGPQVWPGWQYSWPQLKMESSTLSV